MPDTDLTAQFVFTLAQASTRTVTLNWETRDGTAVENIDYVPASGQLVFQPGETSKSVNIQVLQPPTEERKFFTVAITGAVNATVDESEPGQVVIMPSNVFRGKRGFKGDRGQRGMSAYEEAVANGTFVGTYTQWLDSLAAAPLAALSNGSDPAKGAALTAFNADLPYPPSTVGGELKVLPTKLDRKDLSAVEAFAYKKKVKAFPYKHPQYAEAVSRFGSIYPQSFCIDVAAGEILFIAEAGQVTVFAWPGGAYIKTYRCPLTYVSENAVIKYESGIRKLYLRGADNFQVFDITATAQWQTLNPMATFPVNVQRNFAEHADEWLLSSNTVIPLGQFRSRGYFGIFDASFTQIGSVYISPLQCGINEGLPYEGAISKMQGMAYDGKNIYLGMGGFWDGATYNNQKYGAFGVRKFTRQGDLIGDFLLSPQKLVAKLRSYGFNPGHCENEGVQYVKETGKVYSLMVGATSTTADAIANVEGLYIFEEFCPDRDALDFSDCATTASTFSEIFRASGLYPRSQGGLPNPLSGGFFSTWAEVIDYMKSVDMSVFSYYSSTVPLTDFNGTAVASGYLVTISNCNNNTFRVEARGDNSTLNYRIVAGVQTPYQPRPTQPLLPATDNNVSAGSASLRFSVVYAGTGAINTSDAREKTDVRIFSEAEIQAAKELAREIGFFRFLSAIAEKEGDPSRNAREHCGMTVQRAKSVLEAHGLDPLNYGFICYDKWEEETVDHPDEVDGEGVVIRPAYTEVVREAGDRFSFRENELYAFIARGFEARLTALEELQ